MPPLSERGGTVESSVGAQVKEGPRGNYCFSPNARSWHNFTLPTSPTPPLPHPLWSQEQCIVRQSSLISLDLHQTRTTQTCVERCFNLQRREHYKMDRSYNVVVQWTRSTSRSRTNPETLHSVHQTPPGWRPC